MSELAELVEPLKRAVAVPGTFDATFTSTDDDDLAATLLDAFAEAQLDGFMRRYEADDGGLVVPDLARPLQALIVIYAAARILENEIGNRFSHVRYEAKGAVFEQDQGTQLLAERLKGIRARKADLLEEARRSGYDTSVLTADLYFIKATSDYGVGPAARDWYDAVGRF